MNSPIHHHGPYLAMAGPAHIRPPSEQDAAIIQCLIEQAPELDKNACYTYLLQAWHFADTCAYAEVGGQPAGYVAAYIPPRQPDTLFIWQVVVAPRWRQQGLAGAMVKALLRRPACADIHYIDSTVAEGNTASEQFFRALADVLAAPVSSSERFGAALFEPQPHASEHLIRIGPLHSTSSGAIQ